MQPLVPLEATIIISPRVHLVVEVLVSQAAILAPLVVKLVDLVAATLDLGRLHLVMLQIPLAVRSVDQEDELSSKKDMSSDTTAC